MPYIKQERRDDLDGAIRLLQEVLLYGEKAAPSSIDGDLNYTITRLLEIIPESQGVGRWRYRHCNMAIGILGCITQEYYRRLGFPLENDAIERNGDLQIYSGEEK